MPFLPATSPDPVALDYARHFAQIGGILCLGRRAILRCGLTLSQEAEGSGTVPLYLTDSGAKRDTIDTFAKNYGPLQTARLNVLWGVRDIRYHEKVVGFDALTGEQDLALGVQFGAQIGFLISSVLGATNNDLFTASSIYAGAGNRRTFVGFQGDIEGREDEATSRWDGILSGARLAWYVKPFLNHVIVASSEFAMGLNQRLPFALTFSIRTKGACGDTRARTWSGCAA